MGTISTDFIKKENKNENIFKKNFKKSDDQTNIDKYRLAAKIIIHQN